MHISEVVVLACFKCPEIDRKSYFNVRVLNSNICITNLNHVTVFDTAEHFASSASMNNIGI